jgi:membrane protease YdiL (CAAX protease family)
MKNTGTTVTILRFWSQIPIWIKAISIGVIVSSVGSFAWPIVGVIIPAPWSILIMGILLWIYVKYFRGNWWPKATAEFRKIGFRSIKMPRAAWKWSLFSALLIVTIWQSGLIVTFRIIEFPGDEFTAGYKLAPMPIWIAWLMIIMSSLVAGICEETGYRGYMQVPLESRYGPVVAISLVSILFLIVHLQQVWARPLLLHLFVLGVLLGILAYISGSLIPGIIAHFGLDIFNFSYWWTDIAGQYDHRPVSETGIDVHFIVWGLIFLISVLLFFWAIRMTKAARGEEIAHSVSG